MKGETITNVGLVISTVVLASFIAWQLNTVVEPVPLVVEPAPIVTEEVPTECGVVPVKSQEPGIWECIDMLTDRTFTFDSNVPTLAMVCDDGTYAIFVVDEAGIDRMITSDVVCRLLEHAK